MLVAPDGERSFVADRGAATAARPGDLRGGLVRAAPTPLHLPVYSLLGEPLGPGGPARPIELARAAGAPSASTSPRSGRCSPTAAAPARTLIDEVAPDLLFATAAEAEALLGRYAVDGLLELAPIAVVKRGAKGATVLARDASDRRCASRSPRAHVTATDTTGAGDAFDAGFLVGWFAARAAGRSLAASLQRAALAGHRAAARQLATPRPELTLA